jgi:hypothetical protein
MRHTRTIDLARSGPNSIAQISQSDKLADDPGVLEVVG